MLFSLQKEKENRIFSDLISNTTIRMLHHLVQHSNLSGGKGKILMSILLIEKSLFTQRPFDELTVKDYTWLV